ncbi:MAG TPA: DUF6766 family protein [Nevskiaceae bacterium]|nr:DUF6766 family protein [Nevskiaceae bacterium]
MATNSPIKTVLAYNGLSMLMFGLFAMFLIGVSITGYQYTNEQLASHGQAAQSYATYVRSGEFIEAVFENWESEFLQMAALVIATIFLRQQGSADSKKLRGKEAVDTSSRYSIIHASSWHLRGKGIKRALYANSLGLALTSLFVLSFALHAAGGVAAHNQEAQQHGEQTMSTLTYIRSAQFWFESFQNWQSEFLAVGTLLVLSIYLRQRGSPESKPIGEPNSATGG